MLNSLMNGSSLSNGLAQGIAATLAASNGVGGHPQPQQQTSVGNGLKEFLLEQHQLQHQHQQQQSRGSFLTNGGPHSSVMVSAASNGGGGPLTGNGGGSLTSQTLNNNCFDTNSGGGGLLSKRFNSSSLVGPLGNLSDLSGGLGNPYEKWSNGSDKLFDHHNDSILELSSKLLTLGKYGTETVLPTLAAFFLDFCAFKNLFSLSLCWVGSVISLKNWTLIVLPNALQKFSLSL